MRDPDDRLETTLIRRASERDSEGAHPQEEQLDIEGP